MTSNCFSWEPDGKSLLGNICGIPGNANNYFFIKIVWRKGKSGESWGFLEACLFTICLSFFVYPSFYLFILNSIF